MFWTVPLSIIRSFSLYTYQWFMSYRLLTACEQDQNRTAVPSWSCSEAASKPVWHIPLLHVQWKTPDDGQRNCPKRIGFYSKNKFEKLVHLVGLIIRRTQSYKSTLFTLVFIFECDRCKQASETAWHVLCYCEALAVLRLRWLGHQFLKPVDFKDISVSRILHCVQSAGLMNA